MRFGSTFSYPHKEFLIPPPPGTCTHTSAGSCTCPANVSTRNPPRAGLYSTIRLIETVWRNQIGILWR